MMIQNKNKIPCSIHGCTSIYIARKKGWLCSFHLQAEYNNKTIQGQKNWNKGNKKPIRNKSKKRVIEDRIYFRTRKEFLSLPENKYCFIGGCPRIADTIEHTAGRWGSKYLDQKFWKPCCSRHNTELENNPELSKKYQLSKLHHGKKM
jgi:hypothetical protein